MRFVAIFGAVLVVPVAASGNLPLTGTAIVIDGDTLEMRGQRIRLNAIDAPESGQRCLNHNGKPYRCGQKAAFALADRIGRGTVRCEPMGRDRYDRIIATCFKDGVNLNGWMVREGWAVAFRKYGNDYIADEDEARANRRGLWAGTFDMPWDWRAARR
ncbi:MAG: thermonuclease family protein [Aestuariivirga sp.]|uniref:thermonuclease family protein n=1 Tax=Aestuariivirga sp. TaxID=2650926 RepID=UPI0038D1020D